MKRVSFQEHFLDLTRRANKIIRRPIDTDEMKTFQTTAMSKIKEMLDMNKVSFVASSFHNTKNDVTPTEENR